MTKLRKLTALLLAGALALLLLTACGGGGSSSPEAQAEANVMRAINSNRAVALSNDPGMREVADARLDELELKGSAFGYSILNKVETKWDDDHKNFTLTLVAKYNYKDTKLEEIIDRISDGDPVSKLKIDLDGKYTKAGVAARTIRGETYIAISLRAGKNL